MNEKKISICGKDISSFRAVYGENDVNREWALCFCRAMAKLGGAYVELSEKCTGDGNVVFDATGMSYSKGSVTASEGKLSFFGSYHSMPIIIEKYVEEVLSAEGEVDITETKEYDLCDTPKLYTKEELMKVLEAVYESPDMLIVGDEVNNRRTMPSSMLEDYYNSTGAYPSIAGMDLGRCGLLLPTLKDEHRHLLSRAMCELVDYAAKGGIVTIASHFTNPTKDYEKSAAISQQDRGHIGDESAWRDLITEGTALNKPFKWELSLDADFLCALRDNGLPVIWRPFHELNGGWFWFSPVQGEEYGGDMPADTLPSVWRYMYNYFNERGLDNLLWEYAPNNMNSERAACDVLYSYPGDEYVDMLGLDWYTGGNYEISGTGKSYEKLMSKGKVTNLAEFGPGGSLLGYNKASQERLFSCKHLDEIIDRMYADGYKIGYILSYASKTSFMWWPHNDEFMKADRVLDLSKMPALFEKIRNK